MLKRACNTFLLAAIISQPVFAKNLADHLRDFSVDTKLRAQYYQSELVDFDKIQISTDNKNTFIQGTVNSKVGYDEIVDIARQTTGIAEIDTSRLIINGHESATKDMALSTFIMGHCIKRKADKTDSFSYQNLNLEVRENVAYIKADVPTRKDKDELINIVKSFNGIKHIKQHIHVLA